MSWTVGIDPSSRSIGIAALHEDGTLTHRNIVATGDLPDRLVMLRVETRRWLAPIVDQGVMCAVIERPGTRFGGAALMAGFGVLMEATRSMLDCPVLDLSSAEWKRHALANGAAKKPAVMDGARLLGYDGRSQDVADAIVIADCAQVLARTRTAA